ncbi:MULTISPECIES: FAD-linked oxidase C-terminal domain-containing protein [Arthrobacter]|uniref:D-lactate dehydrogenase (cytochrome) n=1 Tax=Arthrobacter nanjingensis TaxID=1387716 RepID=A0ABU9KJB5_9MICC
MSRPWKAPRSATAPPPGLAAELATLLGEQAVSTRPLDRYARAHDASHYLLVPDVVVTPSSDAQIAGLLAACARRGAPVTFRSGGTSLSGQAITDGVLADTRRNFGAIEVLENGAAVRVQPGATVRAVNARLARFGRALGPDPASEIACTVGGVVANNSSGMHCGTEANTYRTLRSMRFVLASGTMIDSALPTARAEFALREPDLHEGLLRLRRRIHASADSVATIRHQFSMKNTMGYGINAFLDFEDPLDIFTHLVIGSEGTLAFVAEAVLGTVPVKTHVTTGLLVFPGVRDAAGAVPGLVAAGTDTAELLDTVSLRVSSRLPGCPEEITSLDLSSPRQNPAALLVEFAADGPEELDQRERDAEGLFAGLGLVRPVRMTQHAGERAALWKVRKGLYSTVASARPSGTNQLLEDVAVPVDRLARTTEDLGALLARHHYREPVIFGHAKDGNLHFMLNEDFGGGTDTGRYEEFTEDLVDLVLGAGGTLKAEHGTGRIMAPYVRRQFGDELYQVMQEIKRLADPHGILNPGAVLSDDPRSYLDHLKTAPTVEEEVDRCVECGYCEPVCPSRTLTLTPRRRGRGPRPGHHGRLRLQRRLHLRRGRDVRHGLPRGHQHGRSGPPPARPGGGRRRIRSLERCRARLGRRKPRGRRGSQCGEGPARGARRRCHGGGPEAAGRRHPGVRRRPAGRRCAASRAGRQPGGGGAVLRLHRHDVRPGGGRPHRGRVGCVPGALRTGGCPAEDAGGARLALLRHPLEVQGHDGRLGAHALPGHPGAPEGRRRGQAARRRRRVLLRGGADRHAAFRRGGGGAARGGRGGVRGGASAAAAGAHARGVRGAAPDVFRDRRRDHGAAAGDRPARFGGRLHPTRRRMLRLRR